MATVPVNVGNNNGIRGNPQDMENAQIKFSGEVLTAFDRVSIFRNLVRAIPHEDGKQHTFYVTGRSLDNGDDVHTYTVGTDVTYNDFHMRQRIINLDAPIEYSYVTSGIETGVIPVDINSEIAKQAGEALAHTLDKRLIDTVLLASQTSGIIGGVRMQPDGAEINNDDITDPALAPNERGNAIVSTAFAAVTMFQEREITGVNTLVTIPPVMNDLIQSDRAVNRDFTSNNGGLDTGRIGSIAGLALYQTPHIRPLPVDVNGTNKKLIGLMFSPDAVGLLIHLDALMQRDRLPHRLEEESVKHYMMVGMGVLNPGCALAITSGTV